MQRVGMDRSGRVHGGASDEACIESAWIARGVFTGGRVISRCLARSWEAEGAASGHDAIPHEAALGPQYHVGRHVVSSDTEEDDVHRVEQSPLQSPSRDLDPRGQAVRMGPQVRAVGQAREAVSGGVVEVLVQQGGARSLVGLLRAASVADVRVSVRGPE
jgi:hypothetical protein